MFYGYILSHLFSNIMKVTLDIKTNIFFTSRINPLHKQTSNRTLFSHKTTTTFKQSFYKQIKKNGNEIRYTRPIFASLIVKQIPIPICDTVNSIIPLISSSMHRNHFQSLHCYQSNPHLYIPSALKIGAYSIGARVGITQKTFDRFARASERASIGVIKR